MNLEERVEALEAQITTMTAKQFANEIVLRTMLAFTTTPFLALEVALQQASDLAADAMPPDENNHGLREAFLKETDFWIDQLRSGPDAFSMPKEI